MNHLPITDPLPEIHLGIKAAEVASKAVMEIYQNDFKTNLKNDNEPITEADIQSNEIIKKILADSGHVILSEESPDDDARLTADRVWIVDPLDGTSDFVNKTGEFTIMISLVEKKVPVLGIISQPTTGSLFIAQKTKGSFAWDGNQWTKLAVSNESELRKCRIVGSRFHISDDESRIFDGLNTAKFTSLGSSLKVIEICKANAELYFTLTDKIKQWDTCASNCIVTEAGGKITDTKGKNLEYNTSFLNHKDGIIVTNGIIHNEIVKTCENFYQTS